jgi:glycosyltransferase involved in cell wall biosynthesis
MQPSPAISVLMSVFNGEKYLAECVESILAQSFKDFEFLIIDDGSRDGSVEILRKYEQQDPRIKLTVRPNKGLTRTLNELFAQSHGRFLARMDCDDVAMPERFEKQIAALEADPSLVCVGGCFQLIDADGRPLTTLKPPADDAEIQRHALAGHGSICHPTAMIRREALEKINGYCEDFRTAQDLDLWLRLGEVGKLGNVQSAVLRFRMHEGSVSETRRVEQRASAKLACERAWQRRGLTNMTFEAEEPWRPGSDAESKLKFAIQYGWWAYNSGEKSTARHYAVRAIKAKPFNPDGWKLLLKSAV